jgi:ATP-dependent Clp protease ATP-binding subunit ClpC
MFERYTEKARRVIFLARYEASQYGSPYIETEHLLLGLLREDRALAKRFLGESSVEPGIRTEIERQITQRERISTADEVPLTEECMKVLKLAGEEADRFGRRHIGTEHFLVALVRVEGSLAAKLLRKKGPQAGSHPRATGKDTWLCQRRSIDRTKQGGNRNARQFPCWT